MRNARVITAGDVRPDPARIVEIVCETMRLRAGEILDRRRGSTGAKARAIVIQVGVALGVTMTASGEVLGISPQAASKLEGRELDPEARAVRAIVLERVEDEVESVLMQKRTARFIRAGAAPSHRRSPR